MADQQQAPKFVEPHADETAGTMTITRPTSAYERYMAGEGIPIHAGPGFHDVRELELKDWSRVGGRGAFLVPDNTVDLLGMHVLEIPGRGSLAPERHLYEEKYFVIEGRGATEVWLEGSDRKQRFEWGQGALFAIPVNAVHRLFNLGSGPVRLLVGNTAPPIWNIFDNDEFIFGNQYAFTDRYDESDTYYKPVKDTLATPDLGRAMWRTNVIPDIVTCELPLDNQRSPGYRRIEPHMAGGRFWGFIGDFGSGKYSKAHSHPSGAVLCCVKGEGYTFNWPKDAGITPWQDGKADVVERVDYVAGGLVAAAPGGGDWYHQHFSVAQEGLRMLVFSGGLPGQRYAEYAVRPGRKAVWLNADIEHGGRSIRYSREDPFIRAEYQRQLARTGVEYAMPDEVFVEG